MPGIFGCIGARVDLHAVLEREFSERWKDCEVHRHATALLGGHAFGDGSAIHSLRGDRVLAIDGEWALYRQARNCLPEQDQQLFRFRSGGIERSASCLGNLALLDPKEGTLHLAVDSTGTFPLYYVEEGGSLLFSSLLRPLARAVSTSADDLATLEFLRQAYTLMGKTCFRHVRRLLPGQSLRYRPGQGLRISEQSRIWIGCEDLQITDAAEAAWSTLLETLRVVVPAEGQNALMMSAGWDSRTLLAGVSEIGLEQGFTCYSHGDIKSRELRLVEQTCRSAHVKCRLEPIDDAVLDLDQLRRGFDRVENVVFPHWHRAGTLLRSAGVRCVTAGVYGEILGGHYGPAMLGSNRSRMASLASMLLGHQNGTEHGTTSVDDSPRKRLRLKRLERHWYLKREFEAAIPHRLEQLNAEIDQAVTRLERRGITSPARLVEAFIAEHRGTQYINAQLLSCRAETDIALPLAAQELLSFASRLPPTLKVHNRVNHRMLKQHAPALLRYPLAATLVAAGAPIPVQEVSRLCRKVYERAWSDLHHAAGGRVRPLRLGWVNFDFLRRGPGLRPIIDDLRCDIWDRDALERRVMAIQDGSQRSGGLHPMFDQLSKIYTVDLLLR